MHSVHLRSHHNLHPGLRAFCVLFLAYLCFDFDLAHEATCGIWQLLNHVITQGVSDLVMKSICCYRLSIPNGNICEKQTPCSDSGVPNPDPSALHLLYRIWFHQQHPDTSRIKIPHFKNGDTKAYTCCCRTYHVRGRTKTQVREPGSGSHTSKVSQTNHIFIKYLHVAGEGAQ